MKRENQAVKTARRPGKNGILAALPQNESFRLPEFLWIVASLIVPLSIGEGGLAAMTHFWLPPVYAATIHFLNIFLVCPFISFTVIYYFFYKPMKANLDRQAEKKRAYYKSCRSLMALSDTNHALVRAKAEQELLDEVCRIIVETGEFQMAWVGYAGENGKEIVLKSEWGAKGQCIVSDSDWIKMDNGHGPIGRALKTGQPYVTGDIYQNPRFERWREEALKWDLRSAIVLPLISNGTAFGALTVFDSEVDSFNHGEIQLLSEMAGDLAFGIATLRSNREKEQMKEAIIEANERIKRQNEILETKVAERTKELCEINDKLSLEIVERKKTEDDLLQAKEKAEEATKLKDKFVSLVAHDLRSPFNSIMGYLQIIMNDTDTPMSPGHREKIMKVFEAGAGLLKMTDELLNISGLQTGKIQPLFRFFDAYLVALSVKSKMEYLAQAKGVELRCKVSRGTMIYADFELFSEVILNLVSNSIKFCRKGDTVTLSIVQDKTIAMTVKDTGTGIREEYLPDLFRQDIKTTTRGTAGEKGTGLGLPYCKEIMQAHGGDLSVESTVGQGSVFYARLPIALPLVLLVEDDLVQRGVVRDFLQGVHVDLIEAENGMEALEIMKNRPPHLIISDVLMPEMNGFDFLERIRENNDTKSIPFIMVTGDGNVETRDMAFRKGANDFINKPMKAEDFIPRVKRYLS